MNKPEDPSVNSSSSGRLVLTAQEWLDLELPANESDVVIGSASNPLIRPGTKNLVVAPEKSFKTTFLLRLLAGLSCGETVFPGLPVMRRRRVLYLHGELSNAEIKDRTRPAFTDLPGPYTSFLEGRILEAHLIQEAGQKLLWDVGLEHKPDDLVLDPWQSFIQGYDENSFKDMSKAIGFCNQLIEDSGVTLWIPMHLGKEKTKGPRGHSSISGWRDTLIEISRHGDSACITVEPRWATPPEPFWLRFDHGTMSPGEAPSTAPQTTKIRRFVESKGGRVSRTELTEYLDKSPDAVRKAIERACAAGEIIQDGDSITLPLSTAVPDGAKIQ